MADIIFGHKNDVPPFKALKRTVSPDGAVMLEFFSESLDSYARYPVTDPIFALYILSPEDRLKYSNGITFRVDHDFKIDGESYDTKIKEHQCEVLKMGTQ